MILLTFAEAAMNQSLGEHIFWGLYYAIFLALGLFAMKYAIEVKDRLALFIIIVASMFHLVGMLAHLSALKYVI